MLPYYCTSQLACPVTQFRPFSPEKKGWIPQPLQERPVPSHTTSAQSLKSCVLSITIVQKRFCFHGHPLQPNPKMARRSLLLREILFALLDVRLDGITARLPASWAHFPMLVGKLEGLNQSQSLIHRAANR